MTLLVIVTTLPLPRMQPEIFRVFLFLNKDPQTLQTGKKQMYSVLVWKLACYNKSQLAPLDFV